ncbi:MAG: MIP/aquaporin family protein [Pirellulales bacterium]
MNAPGPASDSALPPTMTGPSVVARMLAELLGTFLLVLFGCGAVHTAVLLGAQSGLWQVAIVWGVAIMLAIYTVGGISGAHINPAITVAFAVIGRHPWRLVVPYVAGQLAGALLAAMVLYALFTGFLAAKETEKHVVRGEPGSEVTAMCYGEFFPNPGSIAAAAGPYDAEAHAELRERLSHGGAFLAELLGTLVLALVVCAVTDETNPARPAAGQAPVFIGLTVSALISVIAPLTQACFNPARDFGPRLFAVLAGWGKIALPGGADLSWLSVYIVAPVAGAVLGAVIYQRCLRSAWCSAAGGS